MKNTKLKENFIALIMADSHTIRRLYAQFGKVNVSVTDVDKLLIHFSILTRNSYYKYCTAHELPVINSFRSLFLDLLPMKFFIAEIIIRDSAEENTRIVQGPFYRKDDKIRPTPTILVEEVVIPWREKSRETYRALYEELER